MRIDRIGAFASAATSAVLALSCLTGRVAPDSTPDRDAASDAGATPDAPSEAASPPIDAGAEPAGEIDPSFGDGGVVSWSAENSTALCLAATGSRIVLGAETSPEGRGPGPGYAIAFTMSGALDLTYGSPYGYATVDLMSACTADAAGSVVAGVRDFAAMDSVGRLARWSPDGVRDATFTRDLTFLADLVVRAPSGDFFAVGSRTGGGLTFTRAAAYDGSLLGSFDVTSLPQSAASGAFAANGDLLVASGTMTAGARTLAAVDAAGPDTTFGSNGTVAVNGIGDVATTPDGDIVFVYGRTYTAVGNSVVIERRSPSGAVVASAALLGPDAESFPVAGSVLVQSNGKIVFAVATPTGVVSLVRVLPTLELDASFGIDGHLALPVFSAPAASAPRIVAARLSETSLVLASGGSSELRVVIVR